MSKSIDRKALVALAGLSASLLAGCSSSGDGQARACTDRNGKPVAGTQCNSGGSGRGSWFHGGGGGSSRRESFIARMGRMFRTTSDGVLRGGFGHLGEGGGHGGGE